MRVPETNSRNQVKMVWKEFPSTPFFILLEIYDFLIEMAVAPAVFLFPKFLTHAFCIVGLHRAAWTVAIVFLECLLDTLAGSIIGIDSNFCSFDMLNTIGHLSSSPTNIFFVHTDFWTRV